MSDDLTNDNDYDQLKGRSIHIVAGCWLDDTRVQIISIDTIPLMFVLSEYTGYSSGVYCILYTV